MKKIFCLKVTNLLSGDYKQILIINIFYLAVLIKLEGKEEERKVTPVWKKRSNS